MNFLDIVTSDDAKTYLDQFSRREAQATDANNLLTTTKTWYGTSGVALAVAYYSNHSEVVLFNPDSSGATVTLLRYVGTAALSMSNAGTLYI